MTIKKITVYKSLLDKVDLDFDTSLVVSKLREKLISDNFISADNDKEEWRFFRKDGGFSGTTLNDALLGQTFEEGYMLNALLDVDNNIRVVNTKKPKPDLIGIPTKWFTDRMMDCQVIKNNHKQDKFETLMLEHVRSANPDVAADYENVVICENDTEIQFHIKIAGTDTVICSIKPDKGEAITDGAFLHSGSGSIDTRISMYYKLQRTIVINSTESLNISNRESIKYMRVTVKAWKVKSWKGTDGVVHNVDTSLMKMMTRMSETVVVPSEGIKPGTTTPGGNVDAHWVGIEGYEDDPSTVLGEVMIHFFIFTSRDAANKIIGHRNIPVYE